MDGGLACGAPQLRATPTQREQVALDLEVIVLGAEPAVAVEDVPVGGQGRRGVEEERERGEQ